MKKMKAKILNINLKIILNRILLYLNFLRYLMLVLYKIEHLIVLKTKIAF